MKQKMQDERIAEFLSDDISAEKKREIKDELIRSGYTSAELTEMEGLYRRLDSVEVPETSEQLDINFYRSLELYKDAHGQNNSTLKKFFSGIREVLTQKYVLGFGYSLILLMAGWYLGSTGQIGADDNKIEAMSRELDQVKQVMMVTMLEQPSATKRIKAILYADDFKKVDDKILNAFLNTLNRDPNPNVRLTAVEALSKYSDIQFVRQGLIKSISAQDSPLVQVALIDLMVRLKEKGSKSELNRLLEKRELNYSVRNKTEESIQLL